VVLLRDRGRRVTKSQIDAAPALVGLLVIGPEPPGTSQAGARGRAELHRPGAGELGTLYRPLFNPVVERLDARGIVLSGYEIDSVDGVSVQYVQAWLVKPLAGANR
jgi:hypothetical protein